MDKLERVLEEIKISDVEPSEDLVRRTKIECNKILRADQKAELLSRAKRAKLTVRLLAAAAVVAFVFVAFLISSIRSQSPINGAAYYTIDINPSFGFTVDENNVVIDVLAQNEDAKELYEGIDCVGLDLQDAIRLVIAKAKDNGYMSEDGDTYVLLGQFLNDQSGENGEELLNQLMASLANELGDGIKLIGVNGDSKDVEEAKNLEISPGLLILCKSAENVDANENLKVEDVVKCLPDENNEEPEFIAPVISGSANEGKLTISWEEIDFSNINDKGIEVEYKLLKGTTLDEIKEMKNVISSKGVGIEDTQPTNFVVELDSDDLETKTYYCLYVRLRNTSKLSNVLPVTAKIADATQEPEATPEPIGDDGSSQISGYISGNKIILSWTKVDSERFSGYKVMYSSTDSTPTYGEDGCYYLEYVTDAEKTSASYKLSNLKGYAEGKKYYFSITVLYDDQDTKVAGNVISKVIPKTTTETATATNAPTTADYPSTNITGTIEGDSIKLSWGEISDDRLEGYKVVYSFTDTTPVYGSSSYLKWITNPSETSTVIDVSELGSSDEERTCYFSITALYEEHSVQRAGNAIAIKIPATVTYITPELNYVSCCDDTGIVYMEWNSIEHDLFSYFNVQYKPEGGSWQYFSVGSSTSYSINAEDLSEFESGKTYYFEVVAVYDGGVVKKTSNVITETVNAAATPTPTPTSTPTEEEITSAETTVEDDTTS